MKNRMWKWLGSLLGVLACAPAAAEDIDLFMGSALTSTSAIPNVLIILDNTANWSQNGPDGQPAYSAEVTALAAVFNGLPSSKFKVGMMLFSETGSGNSGEDGAYVRAAIRLQDSATKAKYANLIAALDQTGDKGNGGKSSKSMWEAFRYFSGGAPYAGNNKKELDYSSNVDGNASDDVVHALAGNALASKSATTYNTPVDLASCAKNYIIWISNGPAQDSNNDIEPARSALQALNGYSPALTLNPSGSQDNVMDEWARYMKESAYGITTYTIDVNRSTTGQGPGWTALLKSMANQSAGKYFSVSTTGTQILDTLNNIFSEIQSVNSVFASVSLPISVNTQGTYLNQVYVGMFRPDAASWPRWKGNLKQYKMGLMDGALKMQDADSKAAINNQTGFVTECARSFWTPSVVDTNWMDYPFGDCLTVASSDVSDYPDGNVVEKGAQAYVLRGTDSRTLKTCNSSNCTSMVNLTTGNVTQAQTGAATSDLHEDYIDFAIGQDVAADVNDNGYFDDRRLDIHGDVVHSRPVAVNFGTDASPSIVVFYGGNDGFLRAVNGNRTAAISTYAAGSELWAFMPGEFHSKIKRQFDNSPRVSYPGSPGTYQAKDYGIDGPVTAYQGTVGGSNKTILYSTMRRGGRSIYAFDVTNSASAPDSPTFKWRIGCSAAGECSTGMTGVGQTWSSVRAFKHANYSSGNSPLLIFGGGYDTCADYDALAAGGANHNCTAASKGHYIYVVDGDTGAVQKTFDTGEAHGVVADVLVVPDASGFGKYAYTADLGGNVYRITMQGAPAAWTMVKIASLGCATTAACAAPRKFMFEPSVIDNGDETYTLYLGSGDREKPLTYYASASAVTNYFFAFTDKPVIDPGTYPGSAYCTTNVICLNSLLAVTPNVTPTQTALDSKPQGWYLGLSAKEQVVTSAIVIFGVVTFSTHSPAVAVANTCTANLGTTKVYNIDYKNASSSNGTDSIWQDVSGDGLPPSPVGGQVTLDTGQTVPFCIGCSPDSPLETVQKSAGGVTSRPKSRLYWYIEK